MKKNINRWLAAAICAAAMLGGINAQAEGPKTISDKVSINDLTIGVDETRIVEVTLENKCLWSYMWAQFALPEGLEFEAMSPEEVDQNAYTL